MSFQECHAKSVSQECLPKRSFARVPPKSVMPGVSSQEDLSKSVSQECHVRSVMPRVSPQECLPKSVPQECLPKSVFPRGSVQECLPRVSRQECLPKSVSPRVSSQECLPRVFPGSVFPRVSCQECREDSCEHSGSWASSCLKGKRQTWFKRSRKNANGAEQSFLTKTTQQAKGTKFIAFWAVQATVEVCICAYELTHMHLSKWMWWNLILQIFYSAYRFVFWAFAGRKIILTPVWSDWGSLGTSHRHIYIYILKIGLRDAHMCVHLLEGKIYSDW